MPGRRYNCKCGKKRFREESLALEAAATDQRDHGDVVSVYRCPGGLAWHVSAHGFTPDALRSVGRRLAHELAQQHRVDVDVFAIAVLRLHSRPDARRKGRLQQCVDQMIRLGLVSQDDNRTLAAIDLPGLRRIVQIGLDAYADET